MPDITLAFTQEEIELIDEALRRAIDDVEDFIESGGVDYAYDDDPDGKSRVKGLPYKWLKLRRRITE